jgi:hypothetical protein
MSTLPVSPINESAYELFDCWLEHWKRENAPVPRTGEELAAAAVPPTQEAGTSPVPASPAAAAPLPRAPFEDTGQLVLRTLTEHLVRSSDPFGPPAEYDAEVAPVPPARHLGERQAGGAILRFPGRVLPTPRPSLTAPWAVPPKAVPAEDRMAAFEVSRVPGLILFSPRHGLRPVLTAVLVVALASVGLATLVAWLAPSDTSVGLAVVLALVTGLLGVARHRATGTTVSIEGGVLKVVQGSSHHHFPHTDGHRPIDVIGEPGDRGWRVLIQRRGMRPFVVDASMVDPGEFTDALRRFRPRA